MEDFSAAFIHRANGTEKVSQPNQLERRGTFRLVSKALALAFSCVACATIVHVVTLPSASLFKRSTSPHNFIKDSFIHHLSARWFELQDVQSAIQGMTWSPTKPSALSIQELTAKTAKLAEDAWKRISGKTSDLKIKSYSEENAFVRVLEGLQHFLNLEHGFNNTKKINKRGTDVDKPYVRRNARQEQHEKVKKREDQKSVHRRLKSIGTKDERTVHASSAGDRNKKVDPSLLSSLRDSLIAALLLVFVGIIFIVALLISSSDSRRVQRMAMSRDGRSIIFDEEEAEIIEFYEQELEAGCFNRTLSSDVGDANAHLDHLEKDEQNESREYSYTNARRGSLGDLYYSRVLQDIEALDCEDIATCEQGESSSRFVSHPICPNVAMQLKYDHTQCATLNSNMEQSEYRKGDDEYNKERQHTQSESSSTSSISSLTLHVCTENIETSLSHSSIIPGDDDNSNASALLVPESHQLLSPATINSTRGVSEATYAPIIQTKYSERKREMEKKSTCILNLERRVSFNPEVSIKEIPRHQEAAISSEKYLYFMLFSVGIAIAVFSLLPTHPSLSPITSMTKKEIIYRADYLLSSQWDVEL